MRKKINPVLVLVLFLVGMPVVSVGVLALSGSFETKELPVLGQVPEFSLTERSGETYGSRDLHGKVWVASFIFTSCTMQCPIITSKIQRLVNKFRFKENWRALSFTTDPENDTAEVLKNYAVKASADPYKWLFLTGPKKEMGQLIAKGFKLANDETNPTIHSEKLVLVDHLRRIRGYYDANEDSDVNRLMKDTRGLLRKAF
jgi:cytochrome oxidase Cu insertion factor (SCO1/SenC/PrrC family)